MSRGVAFSPADVLAIRAQHREGKLSPQAWADARGCAPETVRRIARGETYRQVGREVGGQLPSQGGMAQAPGGAASSAAGDPGEPDDEDLAASLARLHASLAKPDLETERVKRAAELLAEIQGKAQG